MLRAAELTARKPRPMTAEDDPMSTAPTLAAAPDAPPPRAPHGTPTDAGAAASGPLAPPEGGDATPISLRPLRLGDPLRWLARGWRDFLRHPGIGLYYGFAFMSMGWMLLLVFQYAPAYTLALSAGFLLAGPFVCMGLYHVSMKLEQGERPDFGASLTAWDTRTGTMAIFGCVLLVLEMLWGRAALVVFALSFDGMPDFKGSVTALLDPANLEFIIAYCSVGAIFAGLIFGISVVSIPMILHRQVDAVTAGLTSLRVCFAAPGVMFVWGLLITSLVVIAMLPWFLGLLIVGPLLGHASWHAYRAAVGDEPAAAPDDPA
jgi:uncharacterized membrane protein